MKHSSSLSLEAKQCLLTNVDSCSFVHESTSPTNPLQDDCVSIICRHSGGCRTNRGEHGGCGRYTSDLQGEHGEGEPKEVFASLPGMTLSIISACILSTPTASDKRGRDAGEIKSRGDGALSVA